MFTGIVSAVGKVAVNESSENGRKLVLKTPYIDVAKGESIAVNGVCLTATQIEPDASASGKTTGAWLTFFASSETISRSNLGSLAADSVVNLERALRLNDRLSGHLVQGHVDGKARLVQSTQKENCLELEIELPKSLQRYVIEKGSIAVDGVSLTINSIQEGYIKIMLIPHTAAHTTLGRAQPGHDFNVEADMVSKYIENFASFNKDNADA